MHLDQPCALTKAVCAYESSSPPLHRHQSGIKRKEDEEDY